MTQYHEGQEVEVQTPRTHGPAWRKAKIIRKAGLDWWWVEFADCARAAFDADHIRETLPRYIPGGLRNGTQE